MKPKTSRPYFQGARLTASVAKDMGFDTTVITDNMPAFTIHTKEILVSSKDLEYHGEVGHLAYILNQNYIYFRDGIFNKEDYSGGLLMLTKDKSVLTALPVLATVLAKQKKMERNTYMIARVDAFDFETPKSETEFDLDGDLVGKTPVHIQDPRHRGPGGGHGGDGRQLELAEVGRGPPLRPVGLRAGGEDQGKDGLLHQCGRVGAPGPPARRRGARPAAGAPGALEDAERIRGAASEGGRGEGGRHPHHLRARPHGHGTPQQPGPQPAEHPRLRPVGGAHQDEQNQDSNTPKLYYNELL